MRSGATLMELLVVAMILLMITVATIPVLSPAVRGRRIREGARMVSSFFAAARNRALESGRAAGVWIERMPGLAEAANTLHFAEVPTVYTGDYIDSGVQCVITNSQTGFKYYPYPGTNGYDANLIPQQSWWNDRRSTQGFLNLVEPKSGSGLLDLWAYSQTDVYSDDGKGGVRDGDQILLEGIPGKYSLQTVTVGGRLAWSIGHGRNSWYRDTNYTGEVDTNHNYVIRWFHNEPFLNWRRCSPVARMSPLRYQLFRRPVRLNAGSIQLPEGIVIDLNFSEATPGNNSVGEPLHPRTDIDDIFNGAPFNPDDATPILMTFAPGGNVEQLYFPQVNGSGNFRYARWMSREPGGSIYFLIGQREFIIPMFASTGTTRMTSAQETAALAAEVQLRRNWTQPDNLWVRVSPKNGHISTSIIDPITNSFTETALTLTTQLNPATYLRTTRAPAENMLIIGGR